MVLLCAAALGAVTAQAAQPGHSGARTGTTRVVATSSTGEPNEKTDTDIPLCC
ncbi:hypothetical protein ACH4S8_05190 [Streptomyces sp. NPDC021080]|uniref:hypothetical protein n=1 Tax=Streptomyces sp. NPDC021080 TaxID=3365110 RepID=UPI0037A942AB